MSFWDEKEAKKIFKKLPFYNVSIEKPSIKRLNNIDLLHELRFYNEVSTEKTSNTFKGYARSHITEITDSKDPLVQLTIIKTSIEDLFKDLLNEIKGFKYKKH